MPYFWRYRRFLRPHIECAVLKGPCIFDGKTASFYLFNFSPKNCTPKSTLKSKITKSHEIFFFYMKCNASTFVMLTKYWSANVKWKSWRGNIYIFLPANEFLKSEIWISGFCWLKMKGIQRTMVYGVGGSRILSYII